MGGSWRRWWINLVVLGVFTCSAIATDGGVYPYNPHWSQRVKRLAPRLLDPYSISSGSDIQPDFAGQYELNKPSFPNCTHYAPEIPEEQPLGTYVIQVHAVDSTGPHRPGRFTYSVAVPPDQDRKAEFSVDPKTGVVTTAKVFDRDEPHWEKKKWVTIRAVDDSQQQQQLAAVCTFPVVITDINDNHPIFDRTLYVESVPQDTPVSQLVMRISATDYDDGNNGTIQYSLEVTSSPDALDYFRVNKDTGEVTLIKTISQPPGFSFYMLGVATDKGVPPLSSNVSVVFHVTERNEKPPEFTSNPPEPLYIQENFSDFSAVLLRLPAISNKKDDPQVFFTLEKGTTLQTNRDTAFTMESDGNTALLKLGHLLDYERVVNYTLTVRAVNNYDLGTDKQIWVAVEDVNDNIPRFTDTSPGSVLEDEPVGTLVMRVHAVDDDGTYPNNKVTYYLDPQEMDFSIDEYTGDVKTLRRFDREEGDVAFKLVVEARDGAPSSLRSDGLPNERKQDFRIVILDRNDNPPRFTKDVYTASVYENADNNTKVIEVVAKDPDHASVVTYTIKNGNTNNAFWIESTSTRGIIRAYSGLDYEKIKNYTLIVVASDTLHSASATVEIDVININDQPPVISTNTNTTTIAENYLPPYCLFNLTAYDPDIEDHTKAEQNITFFISDKTTLFSVNKAGCVRLLEPLDRDPGTGGSVIVQVIVGAWDEWNNQPSPPAYQELYVELTDVNDNAPFLDMHQPVVWNENQLPGLITQLQATDYDSSAAHNAAPYKFELATDAPGGGHLGSLFTITNTGLLYANVTFDREKQKQYLIPIRISDSGRPTQSAVSTLLLVIGDDDDNPMHPGNSSILVYAFMGKLPDGTKLGRVFVEDKDDWDLPNKHFKWAGSQEPNFDLDGSDGMIISNKNTRPGTFDLRFKVTDRVRQERVDANVTVTIRDVTEEAVRKSGSVRFRGVTTEDFIVADNGVSKREMLGAIVAEVVGASLENVDVFTVLEPPSNDDRNVTANKERFVDVRFSAHGSPVYDAERLDGLLESNQDKLDQLGFTIDSIHIDECLLDSECIDGCAPYLNISDEPVLVSTNRTSFVGVQAIASKSCTCAPVVDFQPNPCLPNPCFNGFPCRSVKGIAQCECEPGYEGDRCEQLSVTLDGSGWAWYPAPPSYCANGSISVSLMTKQSSGLLMYWGPLQFKSAAQRSDFISLEMNDGAVRLLVHTTSALGTTPVHDVTLKQDPKNPLYDGTSHTIVAKWQPGTASLDLESCRSQDLSSCHAATHWPMEESWMVQADGPVQVGGASMSLSTLAKQMRWSRVPTDTAWAGCVSNLTWHANGTRIRQYHLGAPGLSQGATSGCQLLPVPQAATLTVANGFIVAILVCVILLVVLILAFVMYRRRHIDERTKDGADDVRETIMDYADEGYGEGDHCGFDLSVLRLAPDGRLISPYPAKEPLQKERDREASPDIDAFLAESKNRADDDPSGGPTDDVRHYAYEGDGASTGSLSSLASGTDDGDLDFDYLSLFGPRFKKLADMYGEHSSDEDDMDDDAPVPPTHDSTGPPGSESWC